MYMALLPGNFPIAVPALDGLKCAIAMTNKVTMFPRNPRKTIVGIITRLIAPRKFHSTMITVSKPSAFKVDMKRGFQQSKIGSGFIVREEITPPAFIGLIKD